MIHGGILAVLRSRALIQCCNMKSMLVPTTRRSPNALRHAFILGIFECLSFGLLSFTVFSIHVFSFIFTDLTSLRSLIRAIVSQMLLSRWSTNPSAAKCTKQLLQNHKSQNLGKVIHVFSFHISFFFYVGVMLVA